MKPTAGEQPVTPASLSLQPERRMHISRREGIQPDRGVGRARLTPRDRGEAGRHAQRALGQLLPDVKRRVKQLPGMPAHVVEAGPPYFGRHDSLGHFLYGSTPVRGAVTCTGARSYSSFAHQCL